MNELLKTKRVAVVGAGAIGSYYGARLADSGVSVQFLLRSDYDHVVDQGLKITSIDGDCEITEVNGSRCSEQIGVVDLVIVGWKTISNQHYAEVISPLLNENTLILTLQNGLGSTDELARLFGAERVYGMLCFIGVNREGAGNIVHVATAGLAKVGKYQAKSSSLKEDEKKELSDLVSFLNQGGVICEAEQSLERAQWMKLVWNIPFNGLTISEGGRDTAYLFTVAGMEQRIRKIMLEVLELAAGLGHEIDSSIIDRQIQKTKEMKAYRPSSMIDYLEGREVEVDAIWREPLRRAVKEGLVLPEMRKLLAEIEVRIESSGTSQKE